MKDMAKAKQMILDGIRDHIVSHISGKNTAKKMWDALSRLYQNPSNQRKMFLKEKLSNARMQKGEGIDLFLTKIQDIWDELAAIGEAPQDTQLVHLALNNVSKEWEIFIQGILGRDTL